MTIRITHAAGVGDWANGAVVVLDDRRAQRLVQDGYAVEIDIEPVVVKKKKQAKE